VHQRPASRSGCAAGAMPAGKKRSVEEGVAVVSSPVANRNMDDSGKELSTDDWRRISQAFSNDAVVVTRQIIKWCEHASGCARTLAADQGDVTPELVNAFWIKLFGIMDDLRGHMMKTQERLASADPDVLLQLGLSSDAAREVAGVVEAIEAFHKALSQDELLLVYWRRQVACHPIQTAFWMKMRNDGEILLQKRARFAGRDFSYQEERDAISRVLEPYVDKENFYFDDIGIARAFAVRLLPLFDSLVRVLRDAFLE
jgi:hypothetical protein